VLTAFAATTGLMVLLAAVTEGLSALFADRTSAASPYDVISYPVLVTVMLVPFLWAVIALAVAGVRYWRGARGPLRDLLNLPAWRGAATEAARMRYLKGGGEDCPYPTAKPSPSRRYLHGAVSYGFLLCLVSTMSAAVLQDFLGQDPPYPPLSVPVITGTIGGIGMVIGSVGLIVLKRRADPVGSVPEMVRRDYNLLIALGLLGATGLATLLLRDFAIYGVVLVIHLAAVVVCFAVAPYTKFNHVLYRTLALVLDNLERAEEQQAARLAKGD
jgi:citrate/tricarballylate utilization protein